jgi:REP element-mobilizing transposase RayT
MDGLRVLELVAKPEYLQITFSTTPNVAPTKLAARAKGRIQYHLRSRGQPIDFSRKLAVRSLGDTTRAAVEAYVRNQVRSEYLADERFREMLKEFSVSSSSVDLSRPYESKSGRYWYNLHLVLVADERYRTCERDILTKIRDTVGQICKKKGYLASAFAVMPDHLHLAIRGAIEQPPSEIALAFLNNLAHVLGGRRWWEAGYYAGTFGEYGMAAVRNRSGGGEGR